MLALFSRGFALLDRDHTDDAADEGNGKCRRRPFPEDRPSQERDPNRKRVEQGNGRGDRQFGERVKREQHAEAADDTAHPQRYRPAEDHPDSTRSRQPCRQYECDSAADDGDDAPVAPGSQSVAARIMDANDAALATISK